MKNLSFAIGSAYTALLVFLLISIDQLICKFMPIGADKGLVYVAFVAWAVYFLSGGTVNGGIGAAIGYVFGIAFSILIMLLAGALSSLGFFAVPLGAMIVIFFVLYIEKLPKYNALAASFVAAGCFFGIMTYIPDATFCKATIIELVYGALGLVFGWITIAGKSLVIKPFEKK